MKKIGLLFWALLLLLPLTVFAGYAPESLVLKEKGLLILSDTELPRLFPEPTGQKVVYLLEGRSLTLQASAVPSTSSAAFRVESSDESVIKAWNTQVKAVGRGVCTVTLVSQADEGVRTPILMAVGTPVRELKLSSVRNLYDAATPCIIPVKVIPEDADYQQITWKSYVETVFSVDENGLVTPHKAGYGTLSVTAEDGSRTKADCQLRFADYPKTLAIEGGKPFFAVNRSMKLTPVLTPENPHTDEVLWSSSDPEIASVNEKGVVRCLAPGKVTVTAESASVEGLSASYSFTVLRPAQDISFEQRSITLNIGETWKPDVHVEPEDTPAEDLAYVLSDDKVVRLHEDGSLTALSRGNARLRLRSVYGTAYSDLEIIVYDSGYRELDEALPDTETFAFGTSELGRRLLCTRLGSEAAGHRILLTFCMHGCEDEFTRDGLLLTQIAQSTIRSMAGKLPEDWAIYFVPCMNPDGLIGGKSNNGFGRCNYHVRDINRDFPAEWERGTNSRNFTGEAPLSTSEGQALYALAQSIQPQLTVDVHGYISIVNGKDSPEAQAFAETFGLKVKESYSGGMFALWAEQEFGKGFTLELDKPDQDTEEYVARMAQLLETALIRVMELEK